MSLVILSIDENKVHAFALENTEQFIQIAHEDYGLVYERWTSERATKTFGEHVPLDLRELLNTNHSVIEINWGEADHSGLYPQDQAPTQFDAAKQAVFNQLTAGYVMTEADANEFVVGNISVVSEELRDAAKAAVAKALNLENQPA